MPVWASGWCRPPGADDLPSGEGLPSGAGRPEPVTSSLVQPPVCYRPLGAIRSLATPAGGFSALMATFGAGW